MEIFINGFVYYVNAIHCCVMYSSVRRKFCSRVGLPVDEEEDEDDSRDNAPQMASGSEPKPRPKFRKKKGGHMDNRKRRHQK